MTPANTLYFDHYQTKNIENEPLAFGGYSSVQSVYAFEPIPESLTKERHKHILGVQANLWTEYVKSSKQAEYMLLPRLAALCEVQWTVPEKKNYSDFTKHLPRLLAVYDLMDYNYAKHILEN